MICQAPTGKTTSSLAVSADVASGKSRNPLWFLGSGASNHMIYSSNAFFNIFHVPDHLPILIANNTTLPVAHLGIVHTNNIALAMYC